MIELATDARFLQRFVDDLDATAPRPLPPRPDLALYAPADREAARIAWASRIIDEYRSVAIFAELLGLLAELEAPYAALCAVQRLIGDELRHTRVTAEVVDWLGGRGDLAIDLSDLGLPPRGDEPARTRAQRIVGRELVVVEEESIYALAAYRDATTEPAIRAVFDGILVDEVRHAAAGRALFAELGGTVTDEMIADRADVRASYRVSAVGGAGRALGASIELADLERIWGRAE